MSNTSAEQVISVFGTFSGSTITSIGFKTTRGNTHPTYVPSYGEPFSVEGLLLGLFGSLENGMISGLGIWYMPMGGSNPWPRPVPLPLTYLEMSPAYGGLSNADTWDDTTPDMGGKRFLLAHTINRPRRDDLPSASHHDRQSSQQLYDIIHKQ
jgi:hypothetical protein